MANFLFILDPNADRRQAAALEARGRVAFVPRLKAAMRVTSHYAFVWAVAPRCPMQWAQFNESESTDCVVFGEPHDPVGSSPTADELRQKSRSDWKKEYNLDGYYSALWFDPGQGLRAEADVLGLFPLYYWQHGEVLLVATSPDLFRCHPAFQSSVDLRGIAALLLTSGIVAGRTLWTGVRRVAADHILFYSPGGQAFEAPPHPAPTGIGTDDVNSAVAQAAELHREFLKVALRSSQQPGLQLSGGLDSRLLAGLTTELGHRPECLTFGNRRDLDARCATQVAGELHLSQTLFNVNPADYTQFAQFSVETEQLSGGLYAIPMGWNSALNPPDISIDRVVCGLTLDAVIGGPKHIATASDALSFERLRIGRLGFDRKRLDPLIADSDLAEACDAVRDELVETYLRSGVTDHLREWRMNLAHRHRFAVGGCAWRYAQFAWPVMPALDRRLIRLAASLPFSVVKQRQVQRQMLITRFPKLARLELDRNYLDTTPLVAPHRSLRYDLKRRLTKLSRRCQAWLGHDPRFYVRTMQFNSPGWCAIREHAEDARSATQALFRPEILAKVLPDPRVKVDSLNDPIVDSTPLKNTLGLMLWLRQHA